MITACMFFCKPAEQRAQYRLSRAPAISSCIACLCFLLMGLCMIPLVWPDIRHSIHSLKHHHHGHPWAQHGDGNGDDENHQHGANGQPWMHGMHRKGFGSHSPCPFARIKSWLHGHSTHHGHKDEPIKSVADVATPWVDLTVPVLLPGSSRGCMDIL